MMMWLCRWRMAGSSRQIFCDTTSYQFYDTIPAYVLVLKYTDSKSGGSWRREHFVYPKLKNICSPPKSKRKHYDTQKYIPTLGTKSVPKPYVESVPIRTQSWTKYFWTNFGYTLCTKGIPMYKVRQRTYVIVSYLLPRVPWRSQAQQKILSSRPWQPLPYQYHAAASPYLSNRWTKSTENQRRQSW